MADDVQIVFGAKIDDLVSGVKQVNSSLTSIKDTATEVSAHTGGQFAQIREVLQGLTTPLRAVRDNLGELAEAFVAAFAVEKVVALIERMAELGTQTEKTAAILGISTQDVGKLKIVAESTGGSLESMSATVERLALNIQRSADSATGPASLALQKLGLNAKDFIGLNANEYLLKIADAASKFNTNFNLSQVLMALGGRGMQQLIPVMAQGREGLVSMEQSATFVGATLSGPTVEALTGVHKNLVLLKATWEAASATLVANFAPAINSVISALTHWATSMMQVSASGQMMNSVIDSIGYILTSLAITAIKVGAVLKALFTLDWDGIKAAWDSHEKEQQEALHTHMMNMGKIALAGQIALQAAMEPKETSDKKDIGSLGFGANVSAAMKAADDQVKVLQDGLARQKILLDQGVAQFRLTEGQKVEAVRIATDQEYQAELAVLQNELKIRNLSVEQRQTILNKISQLEQKHATDVVKINGDAVAAIQAKMQEYATALQSSFNAQLRGLLAGTTSFKQAFKTVVGDMIIFFIEQVEKMVVQWIISKATMAATDKAAATAQVATAAAAQTAMGTQVIAAIQQKVAEVYAGAAAFFAATLGPGAPAAAAAVAADVDATATSMAAVASAETGAYEVGGGLYELHPKETVLPAPAAQAFRDMAEGNGAFGTGGGVHFHGMMIDGPSISRLFRDNAALMAKVLNGNLSRA